LVEFPGACAVAVGSVLAGVSTDSWIRITEMIR
jgi:hypothetical protein